MTDKILKNIDEKLTQIAELRAAMGLSEFTRLENYLRALRISVVVLTVRAERVPQTAQEELMQKDAKWALGEITTLMGVGK